VCENVVVLVIFKYFNNFASERIDLTFEWVDPALAKI